MRFRFGHKNSCVYSVLPDDFGNLWLSTNRGLSRFTTPKKGLGGVFKNYDMENGLRSYEFGACLKCRDGSLLFWGINEFNIIKPDQVRDNPEIVIRPSHEKLTNRESEILSLLCEGKSYKMIAVDLFISQGTVHSHIKNIYKKLQVNSKSEAVAKALQKRLV